MEPLTRDFDSHLTDFLVCDRRLYKLYPVGLNSIKPERLAFHFTGPACEWLIKAQGDLYCTSLFFRYIQAFLSPRLSYDSIKRVLYQIMPEIRRAL